ncbi:SgcJ/EcaC family oxidoreductase [Dictyobacter aurantiacus]|nr:SgcJ/EcaC family oxidoreductase [Dictyobacter aurantiacus]
MNQTTSNTTAVQHIIEHLAGAWNNHNEDDLAQLFREDGEFTDVAGQLMRGRAEIARMHHQPFTTTQKHAILTIKDIRITWITATCASVDVHWNTTGHQTLTEQPLPARNGLMTLIVVQEEERWLIAVGHSFDFTATYRRSDP